MKKGTGISLAVCALTCAAVLVWLAGGFAMASEAIYPIERTATWFQRNVTCRVRTLWRRQNYAAEVSRLRRENELLRMALSEGERGVRGAPALPECGDCPRINTNWHEGGEGGVRGGGNWIFGDILSRNGTTGVRNFLRVGKGSLDGVAKGAAVAAADGLVGRVDEVSPHTCTVQLITDPEVKVSCRLVTEDNSFGAIYGIVSGSGCRQVAEGAATVLYAVNPLTVRHLGRDFQPPPRTRVETSGLGGVFPKGVAIGFLLGETRLDAGQLEREGELVPAVDFQALEGVFIRRER